MVVGNGGIALDLMSVLGCPMAMNSIVACGVRSGLTGFELIWVLKHGHIGEAFFDRHTAGFLLEGLSKRPSGVPTPSAKPTSTPDPSTEDCLGEAVGPNWIQKISMSSSRRETHVTLETECQVASIEDLPEDAEHRVRVVLTNGQVYEVDVVIAAIGVDPFLRWVPTEVQRGEDGGLLVDQNMQTNREDIYAAGDCCTVDWGSDASPHWFQMRLWTQVVLPTCIP